MLILSYSKMLTFNRCPQKYKYRYVDKYQPEDYKSPKVMVWGSYMHHLLEQYFKCIKSGKNTPVQLVHYPLQTADEYCKENPLVDEYGIRGEVEAIFRNYVLEYWQTDTKLEVVETELKFTMPIYTNEGDETGVYLTGYVDALLRDPDTGLVYIMEHKTTSLSVESRTVNLALDDQVSLYCIAMQDLGYKVGGVIYDVIRKKIPSEPKLLKNGKMSVASVDTTYQIYLNALISNGLDPEDYQEKLEELKTQGKPFFARVSTDRTQEELNKVYQELINRAIVIGTTTDHNCWYRMPCNDCNNDCMYIEKCKEDFLTVRVNPATGEII